MSPYVTSAIVGGAIMFAMQFAGLGFSDDAEALVAPTPKPALAIVATR